MRGADERVTLRSDEREALLRQRLYDKQRIEKCKYADALAFSLGENDFSAKRCAAEPDKTFDRGQRESGFDMSAFLRFNG